MILPIPYVHAQISNPPIVYVNTAPSGACTNGSALQVVISTGQIYSCQNRVWGLVGGSGNGGSVDSVFGRIGVVTAQSGDYSVGQITGAAPLASPIFTGTVQANEIVANNFVGYLNSVSIGGENTVAGELPIMTDGTHAVWSKPSFTGNVFTQGGDFSTPDGCYGFGAINQSSPPVICLWSDDATHVHFGDATKADPSNIALTVNGLSVTGAAASFAVRPTFGTAIPWDSANFDPSAYLPLTGGTISGNLTVTGNLNGNFAISTPGVITGASLNTTGTHASGLQGIADSGDLSVVGTSTLGPVTASSFTGPLTGNASTASALSTTPTLCQTGQAPTGILANGNATGCASSGGFPIVLGSTSIGASSTTTSVAGLTLDGVLPSTMAFMDATSSIQGQINAKASLASPALTGVPTAPTAAANNNTNQIATTAMVQAAISAATPVTEIFGQITIAAGQSEGNDDSHPSLSISSVCVASPMNVISGTPNTNPWEFVINLSPSNISILAQNLMLQKQVYSYMCRP